MFGNKYVWNLFVIVCKGAKSATEAKLNLNHSLFFYPQVKAFFIVSPHVKQFIISLWIKVPGGNLIRKQSDVYVQTLFLNEKSCFAVYLYWVLIRCATLSNVCFVLADVQSMKPYFVLHICSWDVLLFVLCCLFLLMWTKSTWFCFTDPEFLKSSAENEFVVVAPW